MHDFQGITWKSIRMDIHRSYVYLMASFIFLNNIWSSVWIACKLWIFIISTVLCICRNFGYLKYSILKDTHTWPVNTWKCIPHIKTAEQSIITHAIIINKYFHIPHWNPRDILCCGKIIQNNKNKFLASSTLFSTRSTEYPQY